MLRSPSGELSGTHTSNFSSFVAAWILKEALLKMSFPWFILPHTNLEVLRILWKKKRHSFLLEKGISSRCNFPLRLCSEPLATILACLWKWKIILWVWLLSASKNFTSLLSCLEIYWLRYAHAEDISVCPQRGASHGTDWRRNKRTRGDLLHFLWEFQACFAEVHTPKVGLSGQRVTLSTLRRKQLQGGTRCHWNWCCLLLHFWHPPRLNCEMWRSGIRAWGSSRG